MTMCRVGCLSSEYMKCIVIGLAVVIAVLWIAVLWSCLIISVRADEEMIEIIRKADEEENDWIGDEVYGRQSDDS